VELSFKKPPKLFKNALIGKRPWDSVHINSVITMGNSLRLPPFFWQLRTKPLQALMVSNFTKAKSACGVAYLRDT
jgi:hypothetical protein